MRIHSNVISSTDVYLAARIARVDVTLTTHGSRSHDRAFNVLLTGESRRRPNSGKRGAGDDYAATWDQWGVFLAHLFSIDQDMVTPYYRNADGFATHTADRFGAPEVEMGDHGYVERFVSYGWPEDAHGDHRFTYSGVPREQSCTKCSAVTRWFI